MIKVTNVSFGFPQKELYKNIYFEIEDGDHAVLIGSNGTGKSTLISMIMDKDAIVAANEILIEDDFYHKQYGTLFQSMIELDFLIESCSVSQTLMKMDMLCVLPLP